MVGSLGYVTVTTAGTPVRATVNAPTPSQRLGIQSITFQVLPANAGLIYYGRAGMDKSTGVGVLGILPKPASATTGPFEEATISIPVAPAALNAADFYVDATSSGDKVLVRYTVG